MNKHRISEASGPNGDPCSLQSTIELIGGKWKGVLLYHLIGGPKRFNEIRRLCPEITQRVLAIQLRDLERDGLVHRKVYPQVPQKVEYSLTEWGKGLETALMNIKRWGEAYHEELYKEQQQIPQAPASAPPVQ